MDIKYKLKQFGLLDKEAEVYLTLLGLGKATIKEIVRKCDVKRTSIYDILERLKAMKLISFMVKNNKKFYFVDSSEGVKNYWFNKKEEAEKKLVLVEKILPDLNNIFAKNKANFPQIKIFEGREEIKKVFEDLLKCRKKEIWAIISRQDTIELIGEKFYREFQKKRVAAGIKTFGWRRDKSEASKKGFKKEQEALREVYYFSEKTEFTSNIMVYDNKIAGFSSKDENFGFIIESTGLAQTMLTLFKMQWLGA